MKKAFYLKPLHKYKKHGKKYSQAEHTGIFTDNRDGKVYKTITIGSVTIMAENLAYKVNEACFALDNKEQNVAQYGYLYDWNTAIKVAKGVKNWHLPSDKEWRELLNYLGSSSEAFLKLKGSRDISPKKQKIQVVLMLYP